MKDDKKAKQDKIRSMPKMQRSKDLETQWRTGKQPASGYDEADDPAFSSGPDGMASGDDNDQPLPADDQSIMYLGPEDGPFECANCTFFVADGQPCKKVSDPVASEGCCNQFASAHSEDQAQEHMEGGSATPVPATASAQPNMQGAY